LKSFFLPYQLRWLNDKSRIKIFEKSRRIGGTYVQAYEDMYDCIATKNLKVYFSSTDMTAASEYIDYCSDWAIKLNAIAKVIEQTQGDEPGIEFIDESKGIKSLAIEFSNGSKITTLSSNPKAFRSKGGKIVWDEAAWHDNAEKMWAAAKPAVMWGHAMRILSTHNGKNSVFNKLIEKSDETGYSVHRVPITLAVEEGLADRILGRQLTKTEREEWLATEHQGCLTESAWRQEYLCEPQDESCVMLPYTLIQACERESLLASPKELKGELYLGQDVARRNHCSTIYVLEKTGSVYTTRYLRVMRNMPWSKQEEVLYELLANPNVRRACLDKTGLGDQFCERAQERFGRTRVEGVTFTGATKEDLAISLEKAFQDISVLIPKDDEQRESLHSVRKIVTTAGNTRYDAAETKAGHGDHFWALALAMHAGGKQKGTPWAVSSSPWNEGESMERILRGF